MKICPTCNASNSETATICEACGSALPSNGVQSPAAQTGAVDAYSPALPRNTRLKNGAFAIGEVLGQGGFGITYKGGDLGLKRYVAIKEFFPHGAQRRENIIVPPHGVSREDFALARQGFLKEATLLAKFDHPGIVRVFGVWEENDTAYMAMELLDGESLQKRLESKGVMNEKDALAIIEWVAQALSQVHERGLLHRDIKPDNIQITSDNRVVLIDFGTAREFSADRTRAMTAMVTHGYAPLEQYGKQAKFGPYTDVYALAATLYHCLTGQLPTSAMDRVAGVELQTPAQINQYVSRAVSAATMRALEIKATDRFQSVQEFVDALYAQPTAEPVASPVHTPPVHAPTGAQPPQRKTCVHCGSLMPATATKCLFCLKSETDPLQLKPDTLFDKVMFAIPGAVWRVLGAAIVVSIIGRISLGVVRYQNGGRDFAPELSTRLLQMPEAREFTSAKLELGEGVYDEAALVKRPDLYVGKVRLRDGDVGRVDVHVTERDWLYRPESISFNFWFYDFGPMMASQIRSRLNEKLNKGNPNNSEDEDRDTSAPVITDMMLSRRTRNLYTGNFVVDQDFKHPHGIQVTVESFDSEGAPASWSVDAD